LIIGGKNKGIAPMINPHFVNFQEDTDVGSLSENAPNRVSFENHFFPTELRRRNMKKMGTLL
jgi:hypothetical protein